MREVYRIVKGKAAINARHMVKSSMVALETVDKTTISDK